MALIETSGIGATEISGKVGGSVFARGGSGMTVRNKAKGTQAKTNSQLVQQGKFSTNATAWRDLSDAERKAWTLAASSGEWQRSNRLGKSVKPSGPSLYSQLNNTLSVIGGTVITMPPLKVAFTPIVLGALTMAAGTPAMSLAFTGVLDGSESMIVDATFGASPGVQRPSQFRKIATYASTTPANLLSGYQGVFGDPIAGTRVFVRVTIVSETTGQRQVIGQVNAIVAA